MKFVAFALMIAGLIAGSGATSAQQAQTFDHLHDKARVGAQICMTDHWHFGEGGPFKDRHVAERQAIKRWAEFTTMEYGAPWGRFETSAGRRIECKTNADGGTTYYTCGAHGRPCRPAS
jgi:hypothetical protein